MIRYHRSPFGLNLLCRLNGSTIYRGAVPGLLSVLLLWFQRTYWNTSNLAGGATSEVGHPAVLSNIIGVVVFLLAFRLQAAYGRYWEAAGAVYQSIAKWADGVSHTAAYHMQSDCFTHCMPPSFHDYPALNSKGLTRDRERDEIQLKAITTTDGIPETERQRVGSRANTKSIQAVSRHRGNRVKKRAFHPTAIVQSIRRDDALKAAVDGEATASDEEVVPAEPFLAPPRLDGGWSDFYADGGATFYNAEHPNRLPRKGFASMQGGHAPTLFLQELAHLSSLMCAVALSVLRYDHEDAQSPLDVYEAGSTWPAVDPAQEDVLAFVNWPHTFVDCATDFLGCGKSAYEITRYNASRPLPVIGGVSDSEIRFLQMARGPHAKFQLAWNWLSEFITREHLKGSTGEVGDPIISRIHQFLSDGNMRYADARKIMQIPFPYPHASLAIAFSCIVIPTVAFLMDQYATELWLACVLSFLLTTAITGINEVARDLEQPFVCVPNEIPLVTIQAEFNEMLIVMFAGYHPDFFWKEAATHIEGKATKSGPRSVSDDNSSFEPAGTKTT